MARTQDRIPVIIDCDPGADDAVGIMAVSQSDRLDIRGVTSVFGNSTPEQTAANASAALAFCRRPDIPVFSGARQPLLRSFSFSTRYCGDDGFCGSGLVPNPAQIMQAPAGSFLMQQLHQAVRDHNKITILSTGALSNIATVLLEDPSAASGIGRIVAASGYFGLSPEHNRAEWNIDIDPEAANVVYMSGVPIYAAGLDVTGLLMDEYVDRLMAQCGSRVRSFLEKVNAFNAQRGLRKASVLADSVAGAVLLDPGVADFVCGTVRVDPRRDGAGMMRFDPDPAGIVHAACRLNTDGFLRYMAQQLAKLS